MMYLMILVRFLSDWRRRQNEIQAEILIPTISVINKQIIGCLIDAEEMTLEEARTFATYMSRDQCDIISTVQRLNGRFRRCVSFTFPLNGYRNERELLEMAIQLQDALMRKYGISAIITHVPCEKQLRKYIS